MSVIPEASAPEKRVRLVATSSVPPPPPGETEQSPRDLPRVYGLDQAYPNPFNPVTTIRYQLPMASHVQLVVFDLIGQVVQILADERQEGGYKQVTWNGSNVASGIYFYRMEATGVSDPSKTFMSVKKMVLIK